MRTKNITKPGLATFLLDLSAILSSLLLAVALRAQFSNFLFDLQGALSLFPLTLLLRFTILFISEEYTSGHGVVSSISIRNILVLNLIPTALLLILRYQMPLEILRMPVSMVITEYLITSFLMSYSRSVLLPKFYRPTGYQGHVKTLLLWADPQALQTYGFKHPAFLEHPSHRILGCLNSYSVSWFSQVSHIQIYGDEVWIPRLVALDDRIEGIIILNPDKVPRGRMERIQSHAQNLSLSLYLVSPTDYSLTPLL